jgi:hypothetical protein
MAKSLFGSVEIADIGDVETPEEFARPEPGRSAAASHRIERI